METWKPVGGFEGVYSVSDAGRIRYEQSRGRRVKVAAGDIVAQARNSLGYNLVSLARIAERAERKSFWVARLVAIAFIGPPPFPRAQVNHKNGCRSDDAASNLEWVTARENIRHSIEVLGRDYRGTKSYAAKLTEEQVVALRERAASGESFRVLAGVFNISHVTVAGIATGRSYANVGGPLSRKRTPAEVRRLGIPNHAPDVRSNRQRRP